MSRKGDFTTSVDNLFQHSTTLTVLFPSLFFKKTPHINGISFVAICGHYSCPFSAPLRRVWLCLLSTHSLTWLKVVSRALRPPLLLSQHSKPSSLRFSSDILCFCCQIIVVTLLWGLSIFFMPFSYSFMQQHLSLCLLVSFITVHDTVFPSLPPVNDLNSALHLPSPSMFPAMCC